MISELLTVILAVFIAISATLVAYRERYVHDFRNFDLNFGQSAILMNSKTNKDEHHKIAELWLRRSQDYRRMALYITYAAVNMVIASYFTVFALVLDFVVGSYLWILSTTIACIFFLFMLVAWMIRYRKFFKPESTSKILQWFVLTYEKNSFKMCQAFPPLLPPLNLKDLDR